MECKFYRTRGLSPLSFKKSFRIAIEPRIKPSVNIEFLVMFSSDIKPTQILSSQELSVLNAKSNLKGTLQLLGHLTVIAVSGYLWGANMANLSDRWFIAIPALIIYGFSFAIMFAPLHEASHRTVFTNNRANDALSWFAGLLSFYNSTFYRLYHKWHHRYTQIPDKDPELSDRKPTNLKEYIIEISGITWWIGKFKRHFLTAIGNLENCPFIPESSRAEVIRSTRLQLLVYAVAIAISVYFQQPWFITYWMLPLAVGQPILRFLLLAEHTDRPKTPKPQNPGPNKLKKCHQINILMPKKKP